MTNAKLKKISMVVAIITPIVGGILGVLSFIRDAKDPRAQAGYVAHSSDIEEMLLLRLFISIFRTSFQWE